MASHSHHSSTANLVGVHYRVGKRIGEGSFGVIFEGKLSLNVQVKRPVQQPLVVTLLGTNLLNSQTVAIKFVRCIAYCIPPLYVISQIVHRSREKPKHLSFVMNVVHTVS